MVPCIMVTARTASLQHEECDHGHGPYIFGVQVAFVGLDHGTSMYLNHVCHGFKTMLLSLLNLNFGL